MKELEVITESYSTSSFVWVHFQMSYMYTKRVAGSRADNLAKAFACSNTALRVLKFVGERTTIAAAHVSVATWYLFLTAFLVLFLSLLAIASQREPCC